MKAATILIYLMLALGGGALILFGLSGEEISYVKLGLGAFFILGGCFKAYVAFDED